MKTKTRKLSVKARRKDATMIQNEARRHEISELRGAVKALQSLFVNQMKISLDLDRRLSGLEGASKRVVSFVVKVDNRLEDLERKLERPKSQKR